MDRKSKIIFQLDTPFTDVVWPGTSPEEQETILELLCSTIAYTSNKEDLLTVFQSLLSPIGQHRASNTTPSKGKRSKKRKWKEAESKSEEAALSKPPPPEISSFVVVGLNSITRSLEALSQKSKALRSVGCEKNDAGHAFGIESGKSHAGKLDQHEASASDIDALNVTEQPVQNSEQAIQPRSSEKGKLKSAGLETSQLLIPTSEDKITSNPENSSPDASMTQQSSGIPEKRKKSDAVGASPASKAKDLSAKDSMEQDLVEEHHHFSAVFVPRSSQPPILHAHLPQLVVTASLANPELPATRLVQLPKGCEARLSEALDLPRVSFIGLLDGAPHSKSLVDLVRECVPEVKIAWLEEVKKSVYLPVKINAIESFVPAVKEKPQVA